MLGPVELRVSTAKVRPVPRARVRPRQDGVRKLPPGGFVHRDDADR